MMMKKKKMMRKMKNHKKKKKYPLPSTIMLTNITRNIKNDPFSWMISSYNELINIESLEKIDEEITSFATNHIQKQQQEEEEDHKNMDKPIEKYISMNINKNLDGIFHNYTLKPAEKYNLRTSMIKLQYQYNLNHIEFWGKIIGIKHDYIIVYDNQYNAKRFFILLMMVKHLNVLYMLINGLKNNL